MSKKKVLLITARADQGGGPKQVQQILKYLKDDFDFYVAAPKGYFFSEALQKNCQQFIEIPHRSFKITTYLKLLAFSRNNDIQIIHSHGFGAGVYSRLLGLFQPKIIHTFHGFHLKESFLNRIKIQIEKSLSYQSTALIAVSKSEKRRLEQIGIHSKVIVNGLENFEIEKVTNGIQSNTIKTLGIISRLDPHKNISWVIRNYEKLSQALYPELTILIAGEGEQYNTLFKLVENLQLTSKIKFLGLQDKYDFFKKVDALLFPSLGEGLPYTVLEAMSYKMPIIASRVDGHTDLLDKESLFEFENFSIKIDHVFNKIECYRNKIIENYNIESMSADLKEIYLR